MTSFNGQICVKTPTRMYCSASPITDCGNPGPPTPADPYESIPSHAGDLDDPVVFLQEVEKVLASRGDILKGKGKGTLAVLRLLLHQGVKADEPFVVTALTCGS